MGIGHVVQCAVGLFESGHSRCRLIGIQPRTFYRITFAVIFFSWWHISSSHRAGSGAGEHEWGWRVPPQPPAPPVDQMAAILALLQEQKMAMSEQKAAAECLEVSVASRLDLLAGQWNEEIRKVTE